MKKQMKNYRNHLVITNTLWMTHLETNQKRIDEKVVLLKAQKFNKVFIYLIM